MSLDLNYIIVKDFLKSSWMCVEALVGELSRFTGDKRKKVHLFYMKKGRRNESIIDGGHFFLRSSVEYSNPQLTVEELQGIVAARLLEVCGNYFYHYGLNQVAKKDFDEILERLKEPPEGVIVPFLLNTDDAEPDRYSMNPLKESIVESGQSAFPSASVSTEELEVDKNFMHKYGGALVSREEAELIDQYLQISSNSYMDMVDAVKYEQLEDLSEIFGMNLCLFSKRMPLSALEEETTNGLLHYIIRESHSDYSSIEGIYNCMGRSMKKKTTLLTVPHSERGYGSKRAARGRIYFEEMKLKNLRVRYKTTPLYPNAIDPKDVSVAEAEDSFMVGGERLSNYDFKETPSSPQFILYSIGSPEDAVIWHGIGAFGASQLVKSFTSTRLACPNGLRVGLKEKYGISIKIPLQFNLIPEEMWFHPIHRNIDASIGCVKNFSGLANMGMKLESLPPKKFLR